MPKPVLMRISLIVLFSLLFILKSFAQKDTVQNTFYRDYTLLYAANYDILNSSENFRTALKGLSDIFHRNLKTKIKNHFARNFTDVVWTSVIKWGVFLLPHELGHWLRVNQHNGRFTFERLAFPGVISSLELLPNAPVEHHQLSLIGGFEANYLSAKNIQLDFHQHNGLYNDELGMAFAHRIIYPLYAYVFDPQNPRDKNTWILQEGDPVNFVHLTWQMGNQAIFNADSTVNESLIKFYHQAGLVSIVWNLIDINF